MTDLILRDIEPSLVQRVKRLADRHGWDLERALVFLLDRGFARIGDTDDLDPRDARVLAEALAALESVPDDPGFALIGRTLPPAARPLAPEQSIYRG